MTIAPSPEEFLAQTEPDEEDLPEPLESIADSLRKLVAGAAKSETDDSAYNHLQEMHDNLDQAYADLEAKYESLRGLVDDVLAVCKPSVSKLANQVRETVERWRNPEAPVAETELEAEPEPTEQVDEDGQVYAGSWPGDDTSVEKWRALARRLGYTGADVDKLNRSQIRTMLGIEQPVSADA